MTNDAPTSLINALRDTLPLPCHSSLLPALFALWASACNAYDRGLYDRLVHSSDAEAGVVDEAAECEGGLPMCASHCVDLLSDPQNCARCGHACGATEVCRNGSCMSDPGVDVATADATDVVAIDAPSDVVLVDGFNDVGVDAVVDVRADVGMDVTMDVSADIARDIAATDVPHVISPPVMRSIQSNVLPSASGCCLSIGHPVGSVAGDLLLATIAMGVSGAAILPTMTTPTGWTLVRRIDHATDTSLWLFWHVAATSEPATYDFVTDQAAIGGIGWIAAYRNVDTLHPIDSENANDVAVSMQTYPTPSIVTVRAPALLIATFAGHGGTAVTWSGPPGMMPRIDINDGTSRSGMSADQTLLAPGATGARLSTASAAQDYGLVDLLALAPAP